MKKQIEECWSSDGEDFNNDFCSMLDNLRGEYEDSEILGIKVYKAEAHVADPTNFFDMDYFLEALGENAWDSHSEYAQDWPDPSAEAKKRLEKYIHNWLKKECVCNFWHVKNVQEYLITKEDLE